MGRLNHNPMHRRRVRSSDLKSTTYHNGPATARKSSMRMPRFLNAIVLCAALAAPIAIRADDHKNDRDRNYHDKERNDEHRWSNQEERGSEKTD